MQGFQPEMKMRVNDEEEIGACLANNEEYTRIKQIGISRVFNTLLPQLIPMPK